MIDAWKEIAVESAAFYIGWGGLLIGIAFGFIVYRTNFCTMGSVSDILSFGDWNRFRALASGHRDGDARGSADRARRHRGHDAEHVSGPGAGLGRQCGRLAG